MPRIFDAMTLRRSRLFAGLVSLLAVVAGRAEARDNFLIIVADDLGVDGVAVYSDDVAYGHPGEGADHPPTPRIDALAAGGVLFRNAYTNSKCAPSRAQILTGRHALRTGIGVPGGAVLDLAETTIAELVGGTHATAAIGKWHVGPNDDADHPIQQGFDYFSGALNGNIDDYYDWTKTTNAAGGSPTITASHSVYATDDNSAEAIAKIAEFGEDPWLVYLAFSAPHGPFHVPTSPLTTTVDAGSSNRMKYEAAVEAMDREIGDVIDSIPASILADTTIVFLGDNGTPAGVTELPFVSSHAKSTVYEGGINVPLIVRSPHAVPGTESMAFVHSTDVFATIADILGLESTAEDSLSLLPHLVDPARGTHPARPYAYAEQFEPNGVSGPYTDHRKGIRDDQYKLIWRNGVFEEFFDLVASPFEDSNLLPYSGMTEPQQAAYDALVEHMEGVEASGLVACPTRADGGCTTGYLKAKLDWRQNRGLADKVTLKLTKGPALAQIDFGNPAGAETAYSVCVYDDADVLVGEMRVVRGGALCGGKECWKTAGGDPPDGKGYTYKDKLASASGALKMQLIGGDAGKSKLTFVGRGLELPDGVTEALASSTAATVQVRGSDIASCLAATIDAIAKQEADRFKATN